MSPELLTPLYGVMPEMKLKEAFYTEISHGLMACEVNLRPFVKPVAALNAVGVQHSSYNAVYVVPLADWKNWVGSSSVKEDLMNHSETRLAGDNVIIFSSAEGPNQTSEKQADCLKRLFSPASMANIKLIIASQPTELARSGSAAQQISSTHLRAIKSGYQAP